MSLTKKKIEYFIELGYTPPRIVAIYSRHDKPIYLRHEVHHPTKTEVLSLSNLHNLTGGFDSIGFFGRNRYLVEHLYNPENHERYLPWG